MTQHLSRANYQAAIWRKALQPFIMALDITNHGWAVANNMVSIVWMGSPPAPNGILENVHSGCKQDPQPIDAPVLKKTFNARFFVIVKDVHTVRIGRQRLRS